jgi:hypothetical protein
LLPRLSLLLLQSASPAECSPLIEFVVSFHAQEAWNTMFAPLVVLIRRSFGDGKFVKLRGKMIALHSQVITHFCEQVGIDRTKRQNMIRLARDNGKRLGLLA